jgi:O-antigen ligase
MKDHAACRFRDKSLLVLLYIFVSYSIVQGLRVFPQLGFFGFLLALRNTLEYFPLIFIPLALLRSRRDIERLMKCFVVLLFVVAAYGIVQFIFNIENKNFTIIRPDFAYTSSGRVVTSVFPDYNYLACFLILSVLLLLCTYKYLPNMAFSKLTMLLAVIVLLMTQSRTGLITFVIMVFGLLFFRRRVNQAMLAVICAGVLFLIIRPDLTLSRISTIGLKTDIRFAMWLFHLNDFMARPFLGHGLGMFGSTNLTLRVAAGGPIAGVDNFYITTALNLGLVGLIAFAAIIFHVFAFSARIIKSANDRFLRATVRGVGFALVSILIFTVAFNQLEAFPINLYFWFLIGLVYAIAKIHTGTNVGHKPAVQSA